MISKTQLNNLRLYFLKAGDSKKAQACYAARKLMQAKRHAKAMATLAEYGVEVQSHPGQDSTWPTRELSDLAHTLKGKPLPHRWVYQNLKGGIESQGSRKFSATAPSVSRKYFDHTYGQNSR